MTVRFTSRVRSDRQHGTHEIVLVAAERLDQPDRRNAAIANDAGNRNDPMILIEPRALRERCARTIHPPRDKPTPRSPVGEDRYAVSVARCATSGRHCAMISSISAR